MQAVAEKDLGNVAYKKKDFETALKHYNKAVDLDSTNIIFRNNRAGEHYFWTVEHFISCLDPVGLTSERTSVHIDYAVSIRYSSTLNDVASPRDRKISRTNARLDARIDRRYRLNTQTMRTGDNYLGDCCLKVPDIWPVGDRALPTHTLFDLYFAYSAASHSSRRQQRRGRASWVARPALQCRFHAHVAYGQQSCADRKSLICRSASVHGVWPMHVYRP